MLAIEMVLAQEPELALLDEPTGALSHDLAITILKTISEFVRQAGCGVLLVEQNVEEASKVSHRRLCLQEGVANAMSSERNLDGRAPGDSQTSTVTTKQETQQ